MKLIISSNNLHKVEEIKYILKDHDFEVLSLKDEGICIDVVEDGETIHENSYKKAKEIYDYLKERGYRNFFVLSDDSGLMIDALGGAPGVISARFAGENSTDDQNNNKVLSLLNDIKECDRSARFLTVLTLIDEFGVCNQFEGILEGSITREKRGSNGFGYDSIFYMDSFKKTLGEMSKEEKNSISHRFRALSKLNDYFKVNK